MRPTRGVPGQAARGVAFSLDAAPELTRLFLVSTQKRLRDVLVAIDAIRGHVTRGGLDDGLVYVAVRVRLTEIGEAVKALPSELRQREATIPWAAIARMRDHLAHHYVDSEHSLVAGTVEHDLAPLEQAVRRLLG